MLRVECTIKVYLYVNLWLKLCCMIYPKIKFFFCLFLNACIKNFKSSNWRLLCRHICWGFFIWQRHVIHHCKPQVVELRQETDVLIWKLSASNALSLSNHTACLWHKVLRACAHYLHYWFQLTLLVLLISWAASTRRQLDVNSNKSHLRVVK